ncbi:MAG TPA: helix-turn-helix domain-containing protein [Conexibacter sp.]|nr:helix-turn-helix domain-containing protein [Conexibacter sp.]
MQREEQAAATRAELLRVARELFAARGYADVGTEEIVRAAHVTRGALYHHFSDKRDLFRAVHAQLADEMLGSIVARTAGSADAWEALTRGVRAFLDTCEDPAVIRISHLDAPAVLGWAEWREVDAQHWLGLVTMALQEAMDADLLRRREVQPLAHMLLGAMVEASMMIANAADPAAARAKVEGPLLALLEGLRA